MESSETNTEADWNLFGHERTKNENSIKGLPPDEEVYKKHAKRGIALIFNHKHFDNKYNKPRLGTEKDRDDLYGTLKVLNFEVQAYDDLKYIDIFNVIKKVSKTDHSDHDCLFVAVMTHGEDGILYAKDYYYTTKELYASFSPLHCPSLAGKPKLFFIQACRGHQTDPGVKLCYDETDSPRFEAKSYTIPVMADFLIMYATVEDYYAWRDPVKGSCFIQALVNQLRLNHKTKDLLSILTRVNREVAVEFVSREPRLPEFDQKKEMPSIVSMLTRDFYLR